VALKDTDTDSVARQALASMRGSDEPEPDVEEPKEEGDPWWKRDPTESDGVPAVCPHGHKVKIVNGAYVRNEHDSDFDQGCNFMAARIHGSYIPDDELWLQEGHTPELPYVFGHECEEPVLMQQFLESEGMSLEEAYSKAHDICKAKEEAKRKIERPGEEQATDGTESAGIRPED
jgi:hypothetical protein